MGSVPDSETKRSVKIGRLRPADHAAAARVVAQAFKNEGFMSSTLKLSTPKQRDRFVRMGQVQLRYYHDAGHLTLAATRDGVVAGVAVITVPHPEPALPWYRRLARLAPGLPALAPMLLDVRWRQVARIAVRMKAPPELSKPYYRLDMIGVAPEFQGQGIGGRLLTYLHERVDRDERATGTYLYTGDEPNTRIYARYGYKILATRQAGPLTMWFMFRPGHPGAGAA
jgi:GNAT superfamily N-acetyltransferase